MKPIVVTGGAGFIGSNIIKGLNVEGNNQIIVVDNLTNAKKFKNIADLNIIDFIDKNDFINQIISEPDLFKDIGAIFHQGACSDTMEQNGYYMMKNNFEYSKKIFNYCQIYNIPFIYASSAAVYGNDISFIEHKQFEKPLNIYGYSKLLFDEYIRYKLPKCRSQVVGFRYFNVYGPREFHKNKMASVALHHFLQFKQNAQVKLFGEYGGYKAGTHTRDFIYVEDIVKANLFMLNNAQIRGIFNLGTGRSEPFNNIAQNVISQSVKQNLSLQQTIDEGLLQYIDFPESLKGKYQSFTQANLSNLRKAGYMEEFLTVSQGVKLYIDWLDQNYHNFID